MESRRLASRCAFLIAALFLSACQNKETPPEVDLSVREPLAVPVKSAEDPIRIAVGGMITPRQGYAYYKRLLEYMGEKVGRPVKFVDKENYEEINSLLKTGAIDAAFVCSGPYVDGREEFGLELVAMPQAYGKAEYHSYLIAPADSPASDIEGLRGKSFAFTDPQSNTGKLAPTYILAMMGETPESFFGEYFFTYAHDKSIRAVALGLVDGAAVDSLVWEYTIRTDPGLAYRTKVIFRSEPYGTPPFVARPGLEPETKEAMLRTLLDMHMDEKGREILGGMMIDRFVEGDDRAYDSVRAMKRWLAGEKAEGG